MGILFFDFVCFIYALPNIKKKEIDRIYMAKICYTEAWIFDKIRMILF